MSGAELAAAYTASDGTDVALDAATVRKYIVTGTADADDADVARFLALCRARGLNPLAGDAYLIKYDGGAPASVIVGKDFYLRTASAQPTYAGLRAGVVVVTSSGELVEREGALVGSTTERLVGGWAEVHDSRWATPMRAVVSLGEYSTGRSLWRTKPATMIRKVALVQALREAYPAALAGLYDEAEMPAAPAAPVEINVEEE